ncbi:MAG TPA: fumarylacetoacetate hydrolase family protein [Janthinobacterium sp.]|nr:fumarylacetoacetate hydrolase family protein [Janthinobacterium sp.]
MPVKPNHFATPSLLMSRHPPDTPLGTLLMQAHRSGVGAVIPREVEPVDAEAAYAVQREILSRRKEGVGAWKVGAPSPQAAMRGTPLPADGVMPDPAYVQRKHYRMPGLELEIGFAFSRSFTPLEEPYSDEEVLRSLSHMATTVEIVSSRIAGWPKPDVGPLTQLADLQNHGALIIGEIVPYDADFPFLGTEVDFRIDERSIFSGTGRNPAGDPRRLLPWLVNHCCSQGWTLCAGDVVTTGSYTGMHFPDAGGTLSGRIGSLPPIRFMLL